MFNKNLLQILAGISSYLLKFVLCFLNASSHCKIIQSIFLTRIHRWLRATIYLIVGYMAFPFIKVLYISLSLYKVILIAAGGAVYSLGAIVYGLKYPKLNPKIFGFHEMFHLLVVIAAILHFIAIYNLI